jgi:hypothetical protein
MLRNPPPECCFGFEACRCCAPCCKNRSFRVEKSFVSVYITADAEVELVTMLIEIEFHYNRKLIHRRDDKPAAEYQAIVARD